MIDRASITQWAGRVPWNDPAQVEQDLIISRALVAIFSDEFLASQLAFRGGTALHKLYLSPRPDQADSLPPRGGVGLPARSCHPAKAIQ